MLSYFENFADIKYGYAVFKQVAAYGPGMVTGPKRSAAHEPRKFPVAIEDHNNTESRGVGTPDPIVESMLAHGIESTKDVFRTVLDETVHCCETNGTAREFGRRALTSIIGLGSNTSGLIALSMPDEAAINMANRMGATDLTAVNDTVKNALAVLAEHIARGLRSRMDHDRTGAVAFGLPAVARGNASDWDTPAARERAKIEFESELGPFALHVAFSGNYSK